MVARCSVREVLLAYIEVLKREAKEAWYADLELYGHGLIKKLPKMPEILNGG